jgi:hypothetical protein
MNTIVAIYNVQSDLQRVVLGIPILLKIVEVGLPTCNGIQEYLSIWQENFKLCVAFQLLFHLPKNRQIDKSTEERKMTNTKSQIMWKYLEFQMIDAWYICKINIQVYELINSTKLNSK